MEDGSAFGGFIVSVACSPRIVGPGEQGFEMIEIGVPLTHHERTVQSGRTWQQFVP